MLLDTNKRVARNYARHAISRASGNAKVKMKKLLSYCNRCMINSRRALMRKICTMPESFYGTCE